MDFFTVLFPALLILVTLVSSESYNKANTGHKVRILFFIFNKLLGITKKYDRVGIGR